MEIRGLEYLRELKDISREEIRSTLFLEPHPKYPTYFLVNSFNPLYVHYLKGMIGQYSAINMLKLDKFYELAEQEGFRQVIFLKDPETYLERVSNLEEPYPYDLNLELKRFQLEGLNYTRDLTSDIINWSTGAGKSVFAVAKAKYLLETNKVDKVVVVSKAHNKINWQRQFMNVGNLEAEIADSGSSTPEKRRDKRTAVYQDSNIFIVNYEKFRIRPEEGGSHKPSGDGQELSKALKGQRVYFVWDEMPTRLKNVSTSTYKGARSVLKATKVKYQSMLTATPLEKNPEDIYACVKLLDPKVFGTVKEFRNQYAKGFSPFATWQVATWDLNKLQEMGMRLAHMTHKIDKINDPEIKAQFPEEHWEDIYIDLSPQDRLLYTSVEKDLAGEFGMAPQFEILSSLMVLQLICNNPLMLSLSESELALRIKEKKKLTDQHCAKLDTLRELLDQIEGKIVLFTRYNDFGAKPLFKYVQSWGHSAVLYDGPKRQEAEDAFRQDPRVKIFVSSDQGSDSINLEQATTVINYDLPWNYSTLLQRVNRINRITSEADHVWYFNLIMAGTIEERNMTILNKKRLMQEAIDTEIMENAELIPQINMSELRFLLGLGAQL